MRRLSQLRTPQGSNGKSEFDRLTIPVAVLADSAPLLRFRDPQIDMAHGAGGKASRKLVEGLFAPLLFGAAAGPLADAAQVDISGTKVAITTDSFVVKPLSYPGGSIGELAVNGTVND